MNFRNFAIGLTASFGLAWLAVVVVPFFTMRDLAPVAFQEGIDAQTGIYHPKTAGRVVNGYEVYAENGCYLCHTQVARPTYAGNDLGRPDFAGLSADPDRGDTRRESNPFDYLGLDFAPIGVTRSGPDLMNYGRRLLRDHPADAESYLYRRLYNPRLDPAVAAWSNCPGLPFLFEKKEIKGQRSDRAVDAEVKAGYEIVPGPKAKALASYLMSLQHDDAVPASMNYAPATTNPEG
ncbi:hypothetical protein [Haloferula sargassicola]|uniref:Cytochrome c domain-containing protein n=1 Tax=Haloferula sargassicola TaxID=490096 RepID=A0ABP9UUI8_9BACT